MKHAAAWSGAGLLALLGIVAFFAWRSPPFYRPLPRAHLAAPILTMEEYGALNAAHPQPYVVEIGAAGRAGGAPGALLLYGSMHTRDPADPQIADIARRWRAFRPTVALIEGRVGFLLPGVMDPVRHHGEMGAVYGLARGDGIPAWSWEPPRDAEIAMMLERFPAERVALFYVLRPYFGQARFERPADPEKFVEEYRRKRTRWPGLENTLGGVAGIDSIWRRDFAGLPDWRETSDRHGHPGYLNELFAESNAIRDEHFAAIILDLVGKGERVFAVAGSSHAVKLEGALRATIPGASRGGAYEARAS